MADNQPSPAPSDRDDGNAPLDHGGFHPRQINKALEDLNTKFDHLTKPPMFQPANVLQLLGIAVAIIVALIGAMGLQSRMDDIRTRQSDAERRIDTRLADIEHRLDGRLDSIDDKIDRIPKAPLSGTK